MRYLWVGSCDLEYYFFKFFLTVPSFFRRSLFILKLGSYQFALLKLVFTILSIVLWTNGNFNLSDVSIDCASILIANFIYELEKDLQSDSFSGL